MRLFVAVELDDAGRDLLDAYQRRLASIDRAVKWVSPEQVHLTLKFLGEVEDQRVPEVTQALDVLSDQAAFDFEIGGVGTFGSPRSPRIVWAGVHVPNEPLERLQKECEQWMADIGFAPEGRVFRPHLTLGRVKDFRAGRQVAQAVEDLQAQVDDRLVQPADQVVLFQSVLRPQGAEYVVAHKVKLRMG